MRVYGRVYTQKCPPPYSLPSSGADFLTLDLFSNLDFFFQAEDGIRDAQESRGLGDVYKRQPLYYIICSEFIKIGLRSVLLYFQAS